MNLITCGHCNKQFKILTDCSECYCPYCGVRDVVEDAD